MSKQAILLSFLIPSRERFDKLLSCIENLMATIPQSEHVKIELLIKLDSDDTESIARIHELPSDRYNIQTLVSDRLGGYRDLYRFYNRLARIASGAFLMCWNDDAQFKTLNWYELFLKEVQTAPSIKSYWFGGTKTMVYSKEGEGREEDWPCFIAHHKKLYDVIGFYSGVGGVDSFLYYVLHPMGLFHQIKEIEIDHVATQHIPVDQRDAVTQANSQDGQMVKTDFRVVRYCQERIVNFVRGQKVEAERRRQVQLQQQQSQQMHAAATSTDPSISPSPAAQVASNQAVENKAEAKPVQLQESKGLASKVLDP